MQPHPGSVVCSTNASDGWKHRWAIFFQKQRTESGVWAYDISEVSPLPLLLFGTDGSAAAEEQGEAQASGKRSADAKEVRDEFSLLTLRSDGSLPGMASTPRDPLDLAPDHVRKVALILESEARVDGHVMPDGTMHVGMAQFSRALKRFPVLCKMAKPIRKFAAQYNDIFEMRRAADIAIKVNHSGRKWMYTLLGKERRMEAASSAMNEGRGKGETERDGGGEGALFYGVDSWVYFRFLFKEDKAIVERIRRALSAIFARRMGDMQRRDARSDDSVLEAEERLLASVCKAIEEDEEENFVRVYTQRAGS